MNQDFTAKELMAVAGPLVTDSLGPLDVTLNQFSSADTATKKCFGFINSEKALNAILKTDIACVLAPLKMKDKIVALEPKITWLFSTNVDLAAREIKKALVLDTPYRSPFTGIHPTAIVDPTAELAADIIVGPNAVIGRNVRIGEGCFVGANAVIEENVEIKNQVTIHPLSYIGHSCIIGNQCEIMPGAIVGSEGYGYAHDQQGNHFRIPHTGRVVLHDDVHVGAGTAIDRGTLEDSIVGQGTKLDNQCHLAHNTIIGKNGLITAQMVTAGSTTIGDNFMCGGKTGIAGHINITDNVNVAALSGINNDVKEAGAYGGHPLLPLRLALKAKASARHLPEMRKQLNRVLRKLFPEEYE